MRVIIFAGPPHLPNGWNKRVAGLAAQITYQGRALFLRKHASWRALKSWLSNASSDKCWYCEAKSGRAPLDVDHFRPKLGVTVDGRRLAGDTGYYWMAYDWLNFRLSCQRCNRPEGDQGGTVRGKASEFPLEDELTRCNTPGGSLAAERPRFLDPCVESDCDLLAHGIDGEVKPAVEDGTWEFQRADYTIRQLGLNAFNTPEIRKKAWRLLDDLIHLGGNRPEVVDHLEQHLSGGQEYSSFFRSAIGTHRDKPWVESLL
ncbi:hypothetical protein NKJ81_20800 [Mesorhizobium sp. M0018]|uniref:hypothetical protein n=1 Tax=Mesorhizobium sp. M0018 TaxID=2956844 RepID=UPI00333C8134